MTSAVHHRSLYPTRAVLQMVDVFARRRGTRGRFPSPLGKVRVSLTSLPSTRLQLRETPSGLYALTGLVAGSDGVMRTLPDGTYTLQIESDFYQTRSVTLDIPLNGSPVAFELRPASSYPFPEIRFANNGQGITLIRGTLYETNGTPIEGAGVVAIDPPDSLRPIAGTSGSTGDFVIACTDRREAGVPPPADGAGMDLTLRITYPAVVESPISIDVLLPGVPRHGEKNLRQTALRGTVRRGPLPVRGAVIDVDGREQTSSSDADGQWFYFFDLRQPPPPAVVTVAATTPQGVRQEAETRTEAGATVVVPAFEF